MERHRVTATGTYHIFRRNGLKEIGALLWRTLSPPRKWQSNDGPRRAYLDGGNTGIPCPVGAAPLSDECAYKGVCLSIDYSKYGLRKSGSDKHLVEEAERHLCELLSDPHYAEAFQRLRRKKASVVLDRRGVLTAKKGQLAASLQAVSTPKRPCGRPLNDTRDFDKVLKAISTHPDQASLAEYCRRLADHRLPKSTREVRQRYADRLAQALRNHKKKKKKKSR